MRGTAAMASLLLVTVLAGCTDRATGYPQKYLLEGSEIPAGLKLSDVSEGEMPVSQNPTMVPPAILQYVSAELGSMSPQDAWAEFLEKSQRAESDPGGGLVLAPLFWSDEAKAKSAIDEAKRRSGNAICKANNEGVALRDKNVVVVVLAEDTIASFTPAVIQALQKKAPGLQNVC